MSRPRPKGRRSRTRHRPNIDLGRTATVTVTDGAAFDCPFCEGTCVATVEHGAVLHSTPVCSKYAGLEPDTFLHAVNDALDTAKLKN